MKDTEFVLHYAPDNASLVIRLALEECGLPYRTSLVDRRARQQASPQYLALNPHGLIPVLETPTGPIFETAAILLWLTDQNTVLGPAPDHPQRGDFLKWLFFMSNTLHPALRMLFYTDKYIGADESHQAQLTQVTQDAVLRHLTALDARWAERHVPMALTLYLASMLRWLQLYPANADKSWLDLTRFPALADAVQAQQERDATRAAAAAEGLGPKPFTAPQPPNPPEGSAT